MPKYAKLDDLYNVIGVLECEDHEVSKTKLMPDGGPRVRPFTSEPRPDQKPYEAVSSYYQVDMDAVTLKWRVQAADRALYVQDVKTEARRRITQVFPEWKQMNMTARAVELLTIQPLTGADLTEYEALQSAWAWIKRVRATSNTLEGLEVFPSNVADDSLWPEYEGN